eukprot:7725003-Karenia_brevis.AAC.1
MQRDRYYAQHPWPAVSVTQEDLSAAAAMIKGRTLHRKLDAENGFRSHTLRGAAVAAFKAGATSREELASHNKVNKASNAAKHNTGAPEAQRSWADVVTNRSQAWADEVDSDDDEQVPTMSGDFTQGKHTTESGEASLCDEDHFELDETGLPIFHNTDHSGVAYSDLDCDDASTTQNSNCAEFDSILNNRAAVSGQATELDACANVFKPTLCLDQLVPTDNSQRESWCMLPSILPSFSGLAPGHWISNSPAHTMHADNTSMTAIMTRIDSLAIKIDAIQNKVVSQPPEVWFAASGSLDVPKHDCAEWCDDWYAGQLL